MEEANYYAIIPADVRYDKRLIDKSKLLYCEITSLLDKYGCCYKSNQYFADLYGISTRTIERIINELERYGYIKREIKYKENSNEIEKRYIRIDRQTILPIKENKEEEVEEEIDTNTYKVIIDYLNFKTGCNYRYSTPNTKTHIKARIREGYTINDFKLVIDNKCNDWLKTQYAKFLRPDTLFGSKFENYLNQNVKKTLKDIRIGELNDANRVHKNNESFSDKLW